MIPSQRLPPYFAVRLPQLPFRFTGRFPRGVRALLALATIAVLLATVPDGEAATRKPRAPVKPAVAAPSGYERRPEVRAFIDELVTEQGFARADLVRAFRDVRFQSQIVAAMQRPLLEPPKWFEYAPQFLTAARVAGGVAWWNAHADALARAETTFGVPPEIVVAIVGVETFYGRNMGRYRVLDALTTLAFDYPRRAAFFRGELREFLLLTRDLGLSPLEPRGSFAGAMGVPQFMPGSYRQFAIDFDDDGRADLWRDGDDVVGSVANFLARHDWLRDAPVLLPAKLDDGTRDAVLRRLDGGLSERRPLAAWAADGVKPAGNVDTPLSEPVGLLLLEESGDEGAASYWIACTNFYVLTRYNRSRLYASAVWHLAQAVREARATARR